MRGEVIEARLRSLGLVIPDASPAVANYVPWAVAGRMLYVSGQLPFSANLKIVGTVGERVDLATAQEAARLCALNILAQARAACDGDLGRVSRVVKLGAFVQAGAGFSQIPAVVNGASDLMVDVFGDAGRHARSAVGVYRLPLDAAVEIDAIFKLRQ